MLLLPLVLATGDTASPLLPALIAALILLIRYTAHPIVAAAPLIAAAALLLSATISGDVGLRDVVIAFIMLAAVLPGLIWRREIRQTEARLTRLDASLSRVRREHGGDEPGETADMERALAAVAARLGARNVVLWDVDGYQGVAHARAASMNRPTRPLRLAGDALGWVWEQGMRLRLDPAPVWSQAGFPVVAERLRRQGESGMLTTYAFEPQLLPADDLGFDESSIYLRGVLALQEARADAAAGKRRVGALLDGVKSIPGDLKLDALAADLCTTAMTVTEATGAAVGMWGAQAEQGELLAVAGGDGGPEPGDSFEPPASELALAIRANDMIVRTADGWRIGRTHLARPDERWISRPRALAVLPLRSARGTVGVLAVWTSSAPELNPEALEMLHALSPYAALHIEHATEFGHMRETAERDPLTQLRNRRAFDQVFHDETHRFERYGRSMTLLMLDLDHFKSINDHFGHEAGDEVLRVVAAAVTGCVRDVDTAARFGGEEFVVLLPETGMPAALEVAERIRAAIAAASITWGGSAIPVTVSIGLASAPERVDHPRALMTAADAALYRAKAAGRNRVAAA